MRFFAQFYLSRCDHIFARGEVTKEYLSELKLRKDQVSLAADIAFSYHSSYCLSGENELALAQLGQLIDQKIARGERIVCISPSVLVTKKMRSNQYSYGDLLIEILKRSDYRNETYVITPNASREGSHKTRNNDLVVIKELRDRAELDLPSRINRKIIWVDYDLNTKGVENIIERANIVIASRFHTMVAALRNSKPTLIIGWGHKYKEVMKRFGQDEFVFDYSMSLDDIVSKISVLQEREKIIADQISNAFIDERNSSLTQFEYISGKFLGY
jgi:polysaccharide pyruvyl transferase WcaK-like protein